MGSLCNKKPQKKTPPDSIPMPANKKFGIDGPPSLRTQVIEMDFTEMKTLEEIVNTFTGSNFHFFLRKNHNFKPAMEKVKPLNDFTIISASRTIFELSIKEEQNNDAYGPNFEPLEEIFKTLKETIIPIIRRYENECPDDKLNRALMSNCLMSSANTYQILQYMKSRTRGSESEKWWTYLSKSKTVNHVDALKEEYNDIIPQLKKELSSDGSSVRNIRNHSSIKTTDPATNAKKDGEAFVQKVFKEGAHSKEFEERFNDRMDKDLNDIQDDEKDLKNNANNYKMNPLSSK